MYHIYISISHKNITAIDIHLKYFLFMKNLDIFSKNLGNIKIVIHFIIDSSHIRVTNQSLDIVYEL